MGTRAAVAMVAVAAAMAAFAGPARAGIGVEGFSRSAGAPGDIVRLTLGCGLCYPPCDGPAAAGPGKTCIPGRQLPPTAFPVSLVPIEKAPKPRRCGPRRLCAPTAMAPPARAPFSYLGEAAGPFMSRRGVPSYRVEFAIPRVPPGSYAYVVFADFFLPGRRGALLSFTTLRSWRLQVRAAGPTASIRR